MNLLAQSLPDSANPSLIRENERLNKQFEIPDDYEFEYIEKEENDILKDYKLAPEFLKEEAEKNKNSKNKLSQDKSAPSFLKQEAKEFEKNKLHEHNNSQEKIDDFQYDEENIDNEEDDFNEENIENKIIYEEKEEELKEQSAEEKTEEIIDEEDENEDELIVEEKAQENELTPEEQRRYDQLTKVKFPVKQVDIIGVEAFDMKDLYKVIKPMIGQELSVLEVNEFVNNITEFYHKNGYVFSKAYLPPQEIGEGKILIKVVEGYIAEIEAEGDYGQSSILEKMIDNLMNLSPLSIQQVENALLLMNDIPDYNMNTVFMPYEAVDDVDQEIKDGALKLKITFTKNKMSNKFSVENFHSRYVGPYVGKYSFVYPGLFEHDSIKFNFLAAIFTPDKMKSGDISYHRVLNEKGTTFSAHGFQSYSNPGFDLHTEMMKTDSHGFGFELRHPVIRQRDNNLFLFGSLNFKDTYAEANNILVFNDRLRTLTLGFNGDITDGYSGVNTYGFSVSRGLDIFGARKTGSSNLSRSNGQSDFLKFNGNFTRLQKIVDNQAWFLKMEGQVTPSKLLSGEEYSIGGENGGRGYNPSQISGEHGILMVNEYRVRHDILPDLDTEWYGFFDIGAVWNKGQANKSDTLASTGAGARYLLWNKLHGNMYFARPITRDISPASNESGNGKSLRFIFTVNYDF